MSYEPQPLRFTPTFGVTPAPKVQTVDERAGNGSGFFKNDEKKKDIVALGVSTHTLPASSLSTFAHNSTFPILLELLCITSKVGTILKTEGYSELAGAIPVLNMITAPIFLVQSLDKAKERLKLMIEAIIVMRFSDAFFWGTKLSESASFALGSTVKGAFALTALGLLPAKIVASTIFTFILPLMSVLTGSLGMGSHALSLWKSAHILKTIEERREKSDLNGIIDLLDYLQGPHPSKEDSYSANAIAHLEEKNFLSAHATSKARFHAIEQKIKGIDFASKLKAARAALSDLVNDEKMKSAEVNLKDLHALYGRLVLSSPAEALREIEPMIALFERFENTPVQEIARKHKESLYSIRRQIEREGVEILDEAISEIHRVLFYEALILLLMSLIVTANAIGILYPNSVVLTTSIYIGTSVLFIARDIFDDKISSEEFMELEKFFDLK